MDSKPDPHLMKALDHLLNRPDTAREAAPPMNADTLAALRELAAFARTAPGRLPQRVQDALAVAAAALAERESDSKTLHTLTEELASLFGWSDRTPLHAVLHVRNAVLNERADCALAEREGEREEALENDATSVRECLYRIRQIAEEQGKNSDVWWTTVDCHATVALEDFEHAYAALHPQQEPSDG